MTTPHPQSPGCHLRVVTDALLGARISPALWGEGPPPPLCATWAPSTGAGPQPQRWPDVETGGGQQVPQRPRAECFRGCSQAPEPVGTQAFRSRTTKGGTPRDSLLSSGSHCSCHAKPWGPVVLSVPQPGGADLGPPRDRRPQLPREGPGWPSQSSGQGDGVGSASDGASPARMSLPRGGPCPSAEIRLHSHIQHPKTTPTGSGGQQREPGCPGGRNRHSLPDLQADPAPQSPGV